MAGEDKRAYQLDVTNFKRTHVIVASDPTIPEGPGKQSFGLPIGTIRGGNHVVLSRETSPLAVFPGDVVYVKCDGDSEPLQAVLPNTAPVIRDTIVFIPCEGAYSVTPLDIKSGVLPMANVVDADGMRLDTDDVAFELSWVDATYGWGVFTRGSAVALNFNTNTTNINASDLVNIRAVAGTTIEILDTDREGAVEATGDVDGNIFLPLADDLDVGWQCTLFATGDGDFTFNLHAGATGESIVAFGDQLTTLGKGVMVSVILLSGKRWLIGGGLTGV